MEECRGIRKFKSEMTVKKEWELKICCIMKTIIKDDLSKRLENGL